MSADARDGLLCVNMSVALLRRRGRHCHWPTAIVMGMTMNVCLLSRCDVDYWTFSIEFDIAQRTMSTEHNIEEKNCSHWSNSIDSHTKDSASSHSALLYRLFNFNPIVLSIKNEVNIRFSVREMRNVVRIDTKRQNSFLPVKATLKSLSHVLALNSRMAQFAQFLRPNSGESISIRKPHITVNVISHICAVRSPDRSEWISL